MPPENNDMQSRVHAASLELLAGAGVAFHAEGAIGLFKARGFKTDGSVVFFREDQVQTALGTAPSVFTVRAREEKYSLAVGRGNPPALAPGYGAPFMIESDGSRRKATIADHRAFCRLVQTSPVINFNGFMMGDPSDLPPQSYHLDMLLASLTLCSKPFMGSPLSGEAAADSVRMARIVFGDDPGPVMVSNINSLAPLQYAREMAQSIMVFAAAGQPVILTGGGVMGSTVPIRPAGLLAIQNAAVLAGVVLAQLVNPGTPVLYGSAGSPLDMRSGGIYHGGPETHQVIAAGVGMANYYDLPSRGGGCLSDAHALDFQAGYQSALAMSAALSAGVSFVLHAGGILGTYMAMSFEKFLADEELCRHLLKAVRAPEVSDEAIDLATIREVGVGGQFLTHRSTFERCRSEFLALPLANRMSYDRWRDAPDSSYAARAGKAVAARLAEYRKPDCDPGLENELAQYVRSRKEAVG